MQTVFNTCIIRMKCLPVKHATVMSVAGNWLLKMHPSVRWCCQMVRPVSSRFRR